MRPTTRDFLRSNFEGSSFVWTQFKTHPLLSVLGLPLLTLDLILLPVRAIAWRKSSTSSYAGDCDSHGKQDKNREGRKERRKGGSKSGGKKEMRGGRESRESLSKDKRRARQDGDGFSQSEQYHGSSYTSSGRHRRRWSGNRHAQHEGGSNGHEIRHSKDERFRAEGLQGTRHSTLRNGPTRIPHQSIYGDKRPSQPPRGTHSRSGPVREGDAKNLPAPKQCLTGAEIEQVPAAGPMKQPSKTLPTQDMQVPRLPASDEQSNSQRFSGRSQRSSLPLKPPPTSSRSRTADLGESSNKTPPISLPQQQLSPSSRLIGQKGESMPHPRGPSARPQKPSLPCSAGTVPLPSSTQGAASKSTSQRRSHNSARFPSRSQSLHPPSSAPRRHQQHQWPIDPIPESRYDSEDELSMVFPAMAAARRADIEGWKGDVVPGAPAPPSAVWGGRDDDYDPVESVGWWESYSQPNQGSVGS